MTTIYKTGKNGTVYGLSRATPVMRLFYVSLLERSSYQVPGSDKKTDPKYSITLGVAKDDAEARVHLKKIEDHCLELAEQYIQSEYKKLGNPNFDYGQFKQLKMAEMSGNKIFRDGDLNKNTNMHGHHVIVAKNEFRAPEDSRGFIVVGGTPLKDFYPGALVRCEVAPACGKIGFFYSLKAIKFAGDDGVRFETATAAGSLIADADDAIAAVQSVDVTLGAALDKALAGGAAPAQSSSAVEQAGLSIL